MRKILFTSLVLSLMLSPVLAAGPTLSDLQSAVMQEDYKKAGELAQDLLKLHLSKAENAEVQYYGALSSLRLGEYPKAHDAFKKLLADLPPENIHDKAAVGLIDSLYMQGQYERALKEALAVIARNRDSELMGLFYLKAARANLKLARWAKAREFLQKILTEYPESFESRIARQLLDEKQYFTVQVGSFADKARAEKLVSEIIERKEYAYILETKSSDGKSMFRVRVGQMTALKDARELESRLSGFGYPTLIYP